MDRPTTSTKSRLRPPASTRDRIFDVAIRLISASNFESVSMRDIADAVGIKAASIYNHFYSKQDIMDSMIAYYVDHIHDFRLPAQEMKRLIEQASKREIVQGLSRFSDVYRDEDNRMMYLSKMIYERRFCDDDAALLYLKTGNDTVSYIHKALLHGIHIGRIANFPALGYAYSFVSQYTCLAVNRFIRPEGADVEIIEEEQIIDWMCESLPMLD